MNGIDVQFWVNASPCQMNVRADRTLLEILRDDLGFTGAKDSCGGEGECGACTVLMDGQAVNACLVLASQLNDRHIVTIEGLARDGELHTLQSAFLEAGAVQCGYCTPGAILASKALLDENPHPTDEDIREALSGNLCRCTGYAKMIAAVHRAAEEWTNDR